MNYHNVRIFTYSWLNGVNQVLCWCPKIRSNFNRITTRRNPSNDNNLLLYFRLMSLRMKIFKINLQFFKSVLLWNVWLFFSSFRNTLFPVVWLILLSFVFLLTEWFWAKTFWAWIRLRLCLGWNRLVSAYFLCHLSVVYFQFLKA